MFNGHNERGERLEEQLDMKRVKVWRHWYLIKHWTFYVFKLRKVIRYDKGMMQHFNVLFAYTISFSASRVSCTLKFWQVEFMSYNKTNLHSTFIKFY